MRPKDYKQRSGGRERNRLPHSNDSKRSFVYGLSLGLTIALALHVYHVSEQNTAPVAVTPLAQTTPAAGQTQSDEPEMKIRDEDLRELLLRSDIVVPEVGEQYILQAGNFRTQEEAQNLEKKILASGHKPTIHKTTEEDEIWYGVQLGPFQALSDANEVRLRLKAHGIEVMVKHHQE